MSIQMKDIQFPTADYSHWKEEAIKALKGKPFDSLFTHTTEGITLEPLYTQEMLVGQLGDKLEKQINTIRSLKKYDNFLTAQQVYGETSEQFFYNLEDSLNRGNDCLTIDSRAPFKWDDANLTRLSNYLVNHSFKFIIQNKNDNLLSVFTKIEETKRQDVTGYIISPESVYLEGFDNVRTLCADTTTYHYEGANIIQELALALAIASKYANQAENFNQFVNQFFVSFAIDTQFFAEIAKLRAFKLLWKAFSSAYGETNTTAIPIVAESSLRSYSKLDVHVNLLRAGNEAFSALIGGADLITVHPLDVLTKPTDKSIRIARNILHVLREESLVSNVLDPSGGSYFIESLTAEFVEKAWNLFIEIEDAGGIDAYKDSGKLQAELEEVYHSRLQSAETRKHSLIGTNIYANPVEQLSNETNPLFVSVKRLAIPFEELRLRFASNQPKIAILTYGKLKDFKPRADFVAGFFATAGITPQQSGELNSIESAIKWIKDCRCDYVIVAAKDDDTKMLVPTLLSEKPKNLILDAAGKFIDEQSGWLQQGLNGFIYAGQNIIDKLNEVLESVKGV